MPKKDLLILLCLLLPAVAWLFLPGTFSMHDDLQSLRHLEMAKCFADGQIPCRWVPDMGLAYGFPLFNFYPPLPYYVGQIYHWLGFSYVDIIKIVGFTGFVLTAVGMYFLGREFFGRTGGLVSSLFYTYAPYHSVDFYVRGAMNEFWAMAFYPFIFLFSYKLIRDRRLKYLPLLSLSLSGLMLSHNLMLMIFTPFFLIWLLFWWRSKKNLMTIFHLLLSGLWALGLAAFFTLPVLFEQKYIHVESLISGYFNYLAHFINLDQIFVHIYWGYGASGLGQRNLSFALGYLQWLVPLLLLICVPFFQKLHRFAWVIGLLTMFTLVSLFMTHSRSAFIWALIPQLAYLQFPWRFMTLAVFFASFLSGALVMLFSRKNLLILLPGILTLLLLLNANFFRPQNVFPGMTDSAKFSGASWQKLIGSGVFDYLPVFAPAPPPDAAGSNLDITSGVGSFQTITKNSQTQKYILNISSPSAVVQLQTFYFPGWRVWLDNREIVINPYQDKSLGRIEITVPYGQHTLLAKFTNTPIRTLGNIFSVISWLLLFFSGCYFLLRKLSRQ